MSSFRRQSVERMQDGRRKTKSALPAQKVAELTHWQHSFFPEPHSVESNIDSKWLLLAHAIKSDSNQKGHGRSSNAARCVDCHRRPIAS